MIIPIASDHAGFEAKTQTVKLLEEMGHTPVDFGTHSDESVDYADYAVQVAERVNDSEYDQGIIICGSGQGVCMTANKHKGIRAALCWTEELGALARQHNDANILCLPARFISKRMAKRIVIAFLDSKFEGGRHQNRVNKIPC